MRILSEIEKTCGVPKMSSSHVTPVAHISYGQVVLAVRVPVQYLRAFVRYAVRQLGNAERSGCV